MTEVLLSDSRTRHAVRQALSLSCWPLEKLGLVCLYSLVFSVLWAYRLQSTNQTNVSYCLHKDCQHSSSQYIGLRSCMSSPCYALPSMIKQGQMPSVLNFTMKLPVECNRSGVNAIQATRYQLAVQNISVAWSMHRGMLLCITGVMQHMQSCHQLAVQNSGVAYSMHRGTLLCIGGGLL